MRRWLGTMAMAGMFALAMAPRSEAAEAPSCRPLVALIDQEIVGSDRYVHYSSERTYGRMNPDVLDVISVSIVAFLPSTRDERVACWAARGGRVADMRTREAAGRASDVALAHVEFLSTRGDEVAFRDLADTFRIERATGYDGPVTDFLRRRGGAFLRANDRWIGGFRGEQYEGFIRSSDLEEALTELAGLCVIHPKGFAALAQSLGYPRRLLAPHPSEKVMGAGDDPAFLAYLDSERDRIVRDCPA